MKFWKFYVNRKLTKGERKFDWDLLGLLIGVGVVAIFVLIYTIKIFMLICA